MFSEKSIHYFIVAALATSFSTDALAATPVVEDNDASEAAGRLGHVVSGPSTSMRATSRGFSDPISLDVNLWNNNPVVAESFSGHAITSVALESDVPASVCQQGCRSCTSLIDDAVVGESVLLNDGTQARIDLGDGRTLELDAIRYQDASFSTTMSAAHLKPINVELQDLTRNLDEDGRQIVDWYRSELSDNNHARDLEFASETGPEYQWHYIGRVVESQEQGAEQPVEGKLPLRVQLHRDAANSVKLAIRVDGAKLAAQLRA